MPSPPPAVPSPPPAVPPPPTCTDSVAGAVLAIPELSRTSQYIAISGKGHESSHVITLFAFFLNNWVCLSL